MDLRNQNNGFIKYRGLCLWKKKLKDKNTIIYLIFLWENKVNLIFMIYICFHLHLHLIFIFIVSRINNKALLTKKRNEINNYYQFSD